MVRCFAEIDASNTVTRVIVAEDAAWCTANLGGTWVETFPDAPGYASPRWTYLPAKALFAAPSPYPYPSWTLNPAPQWAAPVARPGPAWDWNETTRKWVSTVEPS